MFRAVPSSSPGGQIVLLQPLVSSLSVNGRTVCRLRADCSPLSTGILYEKVHHLYPVSNIIGKDEMSESVARMGEKGIKNFEGKHEGNRLNGKPIR